jgi:branched-chain amino acid aminotransferase
MLSTVGLDVKIEKTAHSRLGEKDCNSLPLGTVFTDHMFTVDFEDGE